MSRAGTARPGVYPDNDAFMTPVHGSCRSGQRADIGLFDEPQPAKCQEALHCDSGSAGLVAQAAGSGLVFLSLPGSHRNPYKFEQVKALPFLRHCASPCQLAGYTASKCIHADSSIHNAYPIISLQCTAVSSSQVDSRIDFAGNRNRAYSVVRTAVIIYVQCNTGLPLWKSSRCKAVHYVPPGYAF